MRRKPGLGSLWTVVVTCGVVLFLLGPPPAGETSKLLSIEGTYRLVRRDLPDGTKQWPPDFLGLMTYTKQYRNFNVYWKDAKGKLFSIAYVATYKLTEKEYSEKSEYYMVNDEIGGTGVTYDLSRPSGTSPVAIKGGRIEFQLPLYGEPFVVFEDDKFTATRAGVFVDHWEKVK